MRNRQLPLNRRALIGLCLMALGTPRAVADDATQINVRLKDHRFDPGEIHVPAAKPIVLRVTNEDATAEEFDSTALKVEKIIAGGHYATIRLRPLAPGRYPFMGEFNPATASGVVIAE